MDIIKSNFSPNGYIFKLYPLFATLFVAIQLECILFVHKQVTILYITTTLSGLTFPINLLILAIVTHCYGKQSARQLIWINNLIILQFVLYNILANSLPWAHIENTGIITSYNKLLPLFIKSGITAIIAENIAEFLFVYLYNTYKNKKPKLNSVQNNIYEFIGLFKFSFFTNFIMLLISYTSIFWELPYYKTIILVVQVMLIKSIIELIFSPLAIYLILKVKKFEGFDVHDFSGNNPFLFLMDYKYLNFNVVKDKKNEFTFKQK